MSYDIPYSVRDRSVNIERIRGVSITDPTLNQILKYDGTNFVNANGSGGGASVVNDLTDVTITTPPQNEDLLQYNSTSSKWENAAVSIPDFSSISNNKLIKIVDGIATETSFYETSVVGTSTSLHTYIPGTPFDVLAGSIETELFSGVNKQRMILTAQGKALSTGITITSDGHVGIGITEPEEDFEVDGSIQIDSANVARLKFQQSGATPHALCEIDGEQDGTDGGDIQFYTKVDGGSVTEKLRINNVGAIGIGGANYGTSGQVLTSNDSGSAVSWTTLNTASNTPLTPTHDFNFRMATLTGSEISFYQGVQTATMQGTGGSLSNADGVRQTTSSYVALPPWLITAEWSLEIYFKCEADGLAQAIFSVNSPSPTYGDLVTIERTNTGASIDKLRIYAYDPDYTPDTTPVDVYSTETNLAGFDGTWGHLVVTYNGNSVAAYMNGTALTLTGDNAGVIPAGTRTNYWIGKNQGGGGDNGVELVRFLRFYDSVLTQEQVTTLYNKP